MPPPPPGVGFKGSRFLFLFFSAGKILYPLGGCEKANQKNMCRSIGGQQTIEAVRSHGIMAITFYSPGRHQEKMIELLCRTVGCRRPGSEQRFLAKAWRCRILFGWYNTQLLSGSLFPTFLLVAAPLKWSKAQKRVPILFFPGSLNN